VRDRLARHKRTLRRAVESQLGADPSALEMERLRAQVRRAVQRATTRSVDPTVNPAVDASEEEVAA
jgi:hypothetical protein